MCTMSAATSPRNTTGYGCYYADGGNTFGTRNDLTKNTIIYGHNMEDKANGLQNLPS